MFIVYKIELGESMNYLNSQVPKNENAKILKPLELEIIEKKNNFELAIVNLKHSSVALVNPNSVYGYKQSYRSIRSFP